ncbi:MAG: hypothetical protein J6X34_11135, partial [Clostridia bacterium]|nr:hypothetical protein [Clostridia bacterium]
CKNCDYSANSNHAVSTLPNAVADGKEYFAELKIIDTPNTHSIEELCEVNGINENLAKKIILSLQ